MTTATAPMPTTSPDRPLDDHTQALIDSRLETIERMLFGQTPRADRLAIVREVEAQIHDLLADRNPDDTDRDAVIAALARLDPPEAFLPDEAGITARPRESPHRVAPASLPRPAHAPQAVVGNPPVAKVSGILGIVSLALIPLVAVTWYVTLSANRENGLYLITGFGLISFLQIVSSVLAIVFASYSRLKGAWSVVGLTSGMFDITVGSMLGGSMIVILLG